MTCVFFSFHSVQAKCYIRMHAKVEKGLLGASTTASREMVLEISAAKLIFHIELTISTSKTGLLDLAVRVKGKAHVIRVTEPSPPRSTM